MKYNTFIFDIDGTLIDTGDAIISSLRLTQEKLGTKKLEEKILKLFLGPSLKESVMKYYDLSYCDAMRFIDTYRDNYLKYGLQKSKVFDYVPEILIQIKETEANCAFATLKQYQVAQILLRQTGLDKFADYIALDYSNGMGNKTELIESCINKLEHVDKEKTVMVGDSLGDAKAAQDSGIHFIALGYGESFKKRELLNLYPNDYVARDEEDLYEYIVSSFK